MQIWNSIISVNNPNKDNIYGFAILIHIKVGDWDQIWDRIKLKIAIWHLCV